MSSGVLPTSGLVTGAGDVTEDNPQAFDDDEETFDPEEGERQIDEFLAAAADLGGTPVDELAAGVVDTVANAQAEVTRLLDDEPTNKIIATMLVLSRRHRAHVNEDTDVQWRLSAAATLVSGLIRPGEG